MQDDICALAEMRGYGRNATTTQQLQALDQEYHQLLEQGKLTKELSKKKHSSGKKSEFCKLFIFKRFMGKIIC